MNTDWCYCGYGWRVYKNNSFVGYVVAPSEIVAYRLAKDKFGDNILVERVSAPSYSG